jgi:hypothetical protein
MEKALPIPSNTRVGVYAKLTTVAACDGSLTTNQFVKKGGMIYRSTFTGGCLSF